MAPPCHAHVPPSPPQGPLIFLFCVVLSKEVRRSLRLSCTRRRSPDPALATKSTLTPVSAAGDWDGAGAGGGEGQPPPMAVMSPSLWQAYGCDSTYVAGRLYPAPTGGSTGSLHSTARSGKSHHSYIPFVRR